MTQLHTYFFQPSLHSTYRPPEAATLPLGGRPSRGKSMYAHGEVFLPTHLPAHTCSAAQPEGTFRGCRFGVLPPQRAEKCDTSLQKKNSPPRVTCTIRLSLTKHPQIYRLRNTEYSYIVRRTSAGFTCLLVGRLILCWVSFSLCLDIPKDSAMMDDGAQPRSTQLVRAAGVFVPGGCSHGRRVEKLVNALLLLPDLVYTPVPIGQRYCCCSRIQVQAARRRRPLTPTHVPFPCEDFPG